MRTSTIAGILFLFFLVPLTTPSTVGADTVIDGISFGDSKVNVRLKTLKSDRMNQPLERRGPSALSPIGKVDLTVESHAFDLIYFFNENGLYRLELQGESFSKDQFDNGVMDAQTVLGSLIDSVYGSSSYTRRLDSEDFDSDGFETTRYWDPEDLNDDREIWVGVVRSDGRFRASLMIQQPEFAEGSELEDENVGPVELTVDAAAELFS